MKRNKPRKTSAIVKRRRKARRARDTERCRRINDAWPRIVAVEPLDGFRLKCRYSDGLEGVADLSDEAELRWRSNPESFAKVAIEGRALVWANGMDACGDFIRLRIQGTA